MNPREIHDNELFETEFLHGSILKPELRLVQAMGNWTRLADVIYDEDLSIVELKQLLKWELQHKGRLEIVLRIHARYMSRKSKANKRRLEHWLKMKKTSKRILG